MESIKRLSRARDLSDLAALLDYTGRTLSYILYVFPEQEKYRTFTIPKRRVVNG